MLGMLRQIHRKRASELTLRRRVPDPSSGRQIRLLHVQLYRPRCLYVTSKNQNVVCIAKMRIAKSRDVGIVTDSAPVYFFLGCVLISDKWYTYISASIIALVGLAYVALEFVPSIEPPANMRYV